MASVKIYVPYHKPYPIVKSDIIVPINLGRAVLDQTTKDGSLSADDMSYMITNMIGDDTGENISRKNREYCELTGLYWIWKNCLNCNEISHIGYMSYRRLFIFNDALINAINDLDEVSYNGYILDKSREKILHYVGLDSSTVLSACSNYDCILPYKVNLKKFGINSVLHDYVEKIPGMHLNDILLLNDYIYNMNPELGAMFKEYLYSSYKYMYQCFILRSNIFVEYCKFMFNILFNFEKQVNVDLYTINGKRTLAYLGEHLYGFYLSYILNCPESKILHLPLTILI